MRYFYCCLLLFAACCGTPAFASTVDAGSPAVFEVTTNADRTYDGIRLHFDNDYLAHGASFTLSFGTKKFGSDLGTRIVTNNGPEMQTVNLTFDPITILLADNVLAPPWNVTGWISVAISYIDDRFSLAVNAGALKVGDLRFGLGDGAALPIPVPAGAWLLLTAIIGLILCRYSGQRREKSAHI